MSREPRQFEVGGIYHIINRGVEQRKIFLKNQDYQRFILGLEFFNSKNSTNLWEIVAKKGGEEAVYQRLQQQRKRPREQLVELLSFVLMPNHFHLIAREIVEGGISAFMRKMGGYASYFNKQIKRTGALFQDRYKVVAIKGEGQLAGTFIYVQTNPVELIEPSWKDFEVKDPEKAIAWLEEYRWSSYPDYLGRANFPFATERNFFLEFFGGNQRCKKAIDDWILNKGRNTGLKPETFE